MLQGRLVGLLAIASACGAPSSPPPVAGAPPSAAPSASVALPEAELAAYRAAAPVFERYCLACHRPGTNSMSVITSNTLDLGTYPFTGSSSNEAGFLIAAALGAPLADLDARDEAPLSLARQHIGAGRPPKARMPKDQPGAVQGDDLERILAWARAWRATRRAGLDPAR